MNERGIVTLIPLLLLLLAVVVIYLLVSGGIIKNLNLPGLKKEAKVELQTQYQNPFDKDAQYVNPFASYKNPFDQLK
ncbi:hypothetical protein HY404_02795 [Candidatus Microgenomates bacterium]|nr:hypothetical protein [Candidatus Microgenomates bacterium]